jgi:ATP-binding protein involved in chromosome partitioning
MTPQEEARLAQMRQQFQQRRLMAERLGHIRRRIGVYSGKGGVGKTTVSVNLAVTLAQSGDSVALFDCDIDCPNVTRVLRVIEPPTQAGERLVPPVAFGVKVMSMAFFQQNEEEAIVWRGPMIHNAINQFIQNTEWGQLDWMVVDLPPGTSDAPLTVMQTLNLDGFVIVTTPQELAVLDARRAINMVRKMKLNVLGVVENFAGDVFGAGAGELLAEEMDIPFLGRAAMRREYLDATTRPPALQDPAIAEEYGRIAVRLREAMPAAVGGR